MKPLSQLSLLLLFFSISWISLHAQNSYPLTKLADIDKNKTTIEGIADGKKLVVISFWATWCKPCISELNAISENYEDWMEELEFKFIAISTAVEPLSA